MEIGQSLMIRAHEMKNCGMDVMDMPSFDCFEAEIISAVSRTALNSVPTIHIEKP